MLVAGGVLPALPFAATPGGRAREVLYRQLAAIPQPADARRVAPVTRTVYLAGREVVSEGDESWWPPSRLRAHFDGAFRDRGWRVTVQPSLAGVLRAMSSDQRAPATYCRPGYWPRFTLSGEEANGGQRYLLSLATLGPSEPCVA
jgi:hypothetical protein